MEIYKPLRKEEEEFHVCLRDEVVPARMIILLCCVCVGIRSCLISSCLQETFGGGGVFDLSLLSLSSRGGQKKSGRII